MGSVTLLKFLLAMPVMLRVASSQANQDVIYRFSVEESMPIIICPLVVASPNPSFALQPSSFSSLIGNYTYPMPPPVGFRFNSEIKQCASDVMCTELSVRYDPPPPDNPFRSNFMVTYTSINSERQRTIQVNYGFEGIYVVRTNRVLRREANNMLKLDGFILVYGVVPQPLVICDSSGNVSDQFSTFLGTDNRCVESTPSTTTSRPVQSDILLQADAMGEHDLYVAANNCQSAVRSEEFTVSLEPATPTTSEEMGSTTVTEDGGGTTAAVIGGVAAAAAVVVICVILPGVALVVWIFSNKVPHGQLQQNGLGHEPHDVEDGHNIPSKSPELTGDNKTETTHPNHTKNGHLPQQGQARWIASVAPKSKGYEVLEEDLADCHQLDRMTMDKDNTNLIRSSLSRMECIVYILQDDNSEITDSVDRHPPAAHLDLMSQIETLNLDKKYRNNVFVVRFKAEKQHHIKQPHYHILLRTEDPTSEGFNSSTCAHSIYCDVLSIRGEMVSTDPTRQLAEIGQQLHSIQGVLVAHGQQIQQGFESQEQQIQSQGQQIQQGFESQEQQIQSQGEQIQKKLDSQGQQIRDGFEQIEEGLVTVGENVEVVANQHTDQTTLVEHPDQ